jgi:hypothetical protein
MLKDHGLTCVLLLLQHLPGFFAETVPHGCAPEHSLDVPRPTGRPFFRCLGRGLPALSFQSLTTSLSITYFLSSSYNCLGGGPKGDPQTKAPYKARFVRPMGSSITVFNYW